jgi:type IV secretion system protein VirB11
MIPSRTATATASTRVRTRSFAHAFSRYLRNVNSGHPGSITTVHADSAALAFEQLTLLVRESEGGRDLPRDDIRALLHLLIDVVVQMKKVDGRFRMTEVWHEPLRKRRAGA